MSALQRRRAISVVNGASRSGTSSEVRGPTLLVRSFRRLHRCRPPLVHRLLLGLCRRRRRLCCRVWTHPWCPPCRMCGVAPLTARLLLQVVRSGAGLLDLSLLLPGLPGRGVVALLPTVTDRCPAVTDRNPVALDRSSPSGKSGRRSSHSTDRRKWSRKHHSLSASGSSGDRSLTKRPRRESKSTKSRSHWTPSSTDSSSGSRSRSRSRSPVRRSRSRSTKGRQRSHRSGRAATAAVTAPGLDPMTLKALEAYFHCRTGSLLQNFRRLQPRWCRIGRELHPAGAGLPPRPRSPVRRASPI